MRAVIPAVESSERAGIDLELIGQRILKLAEIATLEHLESLMRSQADGLMDLMEEGSWPLSENAV